MLQYHQKTVINCSTRSLQFRQPKFTSSWQVTSWSGMCDESPLWVVKVEVAWHCASFWEIKVVCKIKHSHSKRSWWQKDSKRTAAWYDTGVCRSYIFTMSHPPIILTALRNVFFIAVAVDCSYSDPHSPVSCLLGICMGPAVKRNWTAWLPYKPMETECQ